MLKLGMPAILECFLTHFLFLWHFRSSFKTVCLARISSVNCSLIALLIKSTFPSILPEITLILSIKSVRARKNVKECQQGINY